MGEFLLEQQEWPTMPGPHRAFLESCVPKLRADRRLVGLAAGGSFGHGVLDEYSDLDLVVIAGPGSATDVLGDAFQLAGRLGPLLAAFTGEHVGEPRLLICLYGPALLHVDLKFVSTGDLAHRVEDPILLWGRSSEVQQALSRGHATYPKPDLQWIEDRFWVWVHYIVCKIARGELFEALDGLAYIRSRVLGPLILVEAGAQPNGVRRMEHHAPGQVGSLRSTLGAHDERSCRAALEAAIDLYGQLRERQATPALMRKHDAERAARDFLVDELGAS